MNKRLAKKIAAKVLFKYTKHVWHLNDSEIDKLRKTIEESILNTTEDYDSGDAEFENYWEFNEDKIA